MKKYISFLQTGLLFISTTLIISSCNQNRSIIPQEEIVKKAKEQRVEDRYQQEFEMTVDPVLGYVPKKELLKARKYMHKEIASITQKSPIPNINWTERGPNNIGGRTRAIMFDPNDPNHKKVWSGGVGGGVWYSDDITASNANWQKVNDFWSNMAVASLAHDPVQTNVFYAGTGEGFWNADAIDGDGIWKSTDGGVSWNQLSNTTSFNDCIKIVCPKENYIVVATNNGLRLSTNAGSSWTVVRSGSHSDIDVAANGDIFASDFNGNIYKSTNDGLNWSLARSGSGDRVEIACAPGNSSVVYALVGDYQSVGAFVKSTDGGSTWNNVTIPAYKTQSCQNSSDDFTRGQTWYDLIMLVHPTDEDRVIIGGIDLYRTDDGGTTWETISYWTGSCDAYLHADQHALVSRPNNPNAIVSGNDGGVAFSSNAFDMSANPTFNIQNENYNVTQLYAVAVHPSESEINILGGTQDNGTFRLTSVGVGAGAGVTGGDGAFCHIDQDNGNNQITSYVYNNYYISTNGTNFSSYSLGNTGRFINPTDYDNVGNKLYCTSTSNKYIVVSGIGGALSNTEFTQNNFGGTISTIKVSPNNNNTVYFGIASSKICKLTDAANNSGFVDLGQPASGYVSSIDVERGNENHILVTYSNYGMTSVFESIDGGQSWIPCEGNLPNIPVRWGIFDPNDPNQVLLATELGVWSTNNLNGNSTDWDPTVTGLANVRVDMLEYRESDNFLVAGTHGRGVFTTTSLNLNCNISNLIVGQQNCNSTTNTYSQEITITLSNTPGSGSLNINGQLFNFPFNSTETTQTYTLTNLAADGSSVELTMFYTDLSSCSKVITDAFYAPNAGCVVDNFACNNSFLISNNGTYASNGPSDGNGCFNCSGSSHADWYYFVAPSNGTIEISSCDYGVDTRFHIYEGTCNSLINVGGNDDACTLNGSGTFAYASLDAISVESGKTYYIEWDNRWSASAFTFDFSFVSDGCTGDHLYVDHTATGVETGCDWTNAYTNLQDAINAAAENSGIIEIWVKSGTYFPGATGETIDRNTSFSSSAEIAILGGFDGTETDKSQRDFNNNTTILSGDVGIENVDIDNSLHVINHNSSKNLAIDGFTIQKGYANIPPELSGAAIKNSGKLEVLNCIFQDNTSTNSGSAILNSGASAEFDMSNSTFMNNSAIPFLNSNNAVIRIKAETQSALMN